MKKTSQSVTSLPPSPDEERKTRMLKYTIAMSVRLVCVVLVFFVHGWWLLLVVIGAIVLPYIAVVLANTTSNSGSAPVLRPGGLVPLPRSNGPDRQ